jgi:hypothetical protein
VSSLHRAPRCPQLSHFPVTARRAACYAEHWRGTNLDLHRCRAHLLQEKDNGHDLDDSESKLGGSLLGGVEYFFTRDTVISGELRYQVVQDIRGLSPSGVLLAAGLKKYF